MVRVVRGVTLVGLVLVFCACTGQPVSMAVQRGATVAISLGGHTLVVTGVPFGDVTSPSGYGGSDYTDPVRGQFVFKFASDPTKTLATRFATELQPSPRTTILGGLAGTEGGRQIVVVADVPTDAPLGDQTLELWHVDPSGQEVRVGTHVHQIRILPLGQGEAAEPTPLESILSNPDPTVSDLIPDLAVSVSLVPNVGGSTMLSSASLSISYPVGEVLIRDVRPFHPEVSHYWFEDDTELGVLTVHGVALGASPLGPFELLLVDTGSEVPSAGDFVVALDRASDPAGQPVAFAAPVKSGIY